MRDMRVERLDHLGLVAGICREIRLAEYLDALVGPSQQQVNVGMSAVATKLVEQLLGPGITTEQPHVR
jgi:Domain of unknown function (DUF4277)